MKAFIMVDLQNDFCPGGALPAREGEKVIPLINRLQPRFDLVVATQDWHPDNHLSFASNHPGKKVGDIIELDGLKQVLWPDHCVQNTQGAEFMKTLNTDNIDRVFQKGTDRYIDSYSGFFDNGHKKSTGLADYLRSKNVNEVYVAGLATDYCVKYTALDAVRLEFNTTLIDDACRGVNLSKNDTTRAIVEMVLAGIKIAFSKDFL